MIRRALSSFLLGLLLAANLPALAQGLRLPSATPRLAPSATTPASAAQPSGAARTADYIVAVVNSEPITNSEVQARLARLMPELQQQGRPLPPHAVLARQVLERIINETVQLQQARALGITVDADTIAQAERNLARQNQTDVAGLRAKLAAEGIDLKEFHNELRDEMLLSRLREREVDPRVQVSDLDVDAFLREQEGSAQEQGVEINLAQVLIPVPEGASDAQVKALQARAQQVADRARAGADFAALVNEYSAASRGDGGQMGLRPADKYPTLFVEATRDAPAGSIVGPVRSGAGFHVLKVVDRQVVGVPATVLQSHVRHILLRTGPQLTEAQARARLLDMRQRIVNKQADFATLAREFSQDASAANGGDLGWSNPGQFVPAFQAAVDALSPGEISEPVVTRYGVHLIQLLGRREEKLDRAQQREVARNMLRQRKLNEAYVTWAQDLRSRAYVEYREPPQ
ncbi:MAG: periplasmic chaperone and peptidyl-prolyl cis-trans isomerase of outer membrane proteins SurA [Burkholderiaceae bacterium]|jgi:peptidyl-prolyl cis-trans isomerase SurA|nr:MAG: periplasmic chaperone and peptidyl-prolyl cis-trans isomerase of outer membrane proteins SurA [Burkholderiaceae bacterium]